MNAKIAGSDAEYFLMWRLGRSEVQEKSIQFLNERIGWNFEGVFEFA